MPPLCVDLDGTLVYGDMSWRSLRNYVGYNPLKLFIVAFWHRKGRAYTKFRLSQLYNFDPFNLPYIDRTINFLRQEKQKGRKIYLCTGSHIDIAKPIAKYLDLFDDVYATLTEKNFIGSNKGLFLSEKFGEKSFDYIGNAYVDIKVWKYARQAIIVNASSRTIEKANKLFTENKPLVL